MRRSAPMLVLLLALAAGCAAPVPTRTGMKPGHAGASPDVTAAIAASPPPGTAAKPAPPPLAASPAAIPSAAPPAILAAAALTGKVKAPASLISNNGGSIISDNGGGIIANNGGGIIANNGGGLRLLAVATEVPVAGATVRLLDAAGQPVTGPDGKPLSATTAADGSYAFATLPADHNWVLATDLGKAGSLTALATKGGGKQVDVNLVSTLTTTYILQQYVKTQTDPIKTLDKLPPDVETDTRSKASAALSGGSTAVPDSLSPAAVTATVESLRKQDTTFDQQMETVKKLLVVAGQSDLGNGLPATQVDLQDVQRLLVASDGTLYIVTTKRIWRLAKDGTLVTAFDSPSEPLYDAALDEQDRLLLLFDYPAAAGAATRVVVQRLEVDGTRTDFGTIAEPSGGNWMPTMGVVAGGPGEALVVTSDSPPPPQVGTMTLWSLGAARPPVKARALPYALAGGQHPCLGRAADGTLALGTSMVMNTAYLLAPGASQWTAANPSMYTPAPATSNGVMLEADVNQHVLSRRAPDGTLTPLLSGTAAGPFTSGLDDLLVAIAPDGTLYASSTAGLIGSYREVYKVANGTATAIAGRKQATQGVATTLPLHAPTSLAAAPDGSLLVLDNGTLLKVGTDGNVTPWPGAQLPTPGLATLARHIRCDALGNVYYGIEDSFKPPGSSPTSDRVVRLSPTGDSATAFTVPDVWDEIGDIAIGRDGPLAVAVMHLDYTSQPNTLLFGPSVWVGLAGTPSRLSVVPPATDAGLSGAQLAVDANGGVYAAAPKQVWKLGSDGKLAPYVAAGSGAAIAVDATGRVYIAHVTAVGTSGKSTTVDRYGTDGSHDIVAGPGGKIFAGTGVDDGLGNVVDMAFGQDGALLLLDAQNKQLKRIPPEAL